MSRSPDDVQRDIERARDQLAGTLDELATRANPHRLAEQGKAQVQQFLATPAGRAVLGAAGGVVVLLVVLRVRRARS